ncbi:tryptophan halogenase family protein [Caulobacter hibisci]|uniref:Tryptophan 7-halogenase n=1 Tax=Caulobacter hibisci TaxID=2035993 RepID=A0ABS0SZU8_9CAUL|nr:tryptophan halogenase family protein [Caulobacter hibisci]MBI1684981.1 tryptophan 7-halogenase [Caulobacter hibisci]
MEDPGKISHVVIVGGGTAGWMSAAFLSRMFPQRQMRITVVESAEIGTVGVGEATVPSILFFNQFVGVDEPTMMSASQGSFKLGIEFVGWSDPGARYLHPFGAFGAPMEGVSFHAYWLRARRRGYKAELAEFSLNSLAAQGGRFDWHVDDPHDPRSGMVHAYHFDASLYAQLLRRVSEGRGVRRVERTIRGVNLDPVDGTIASLALDDGETLAGDFFIDCSGFRGLLIGQALGMGYEDWSEYLPANRAVAVPSARYEDPVPYTRATAERAGWRWRIPLQHRTGNGYVYVADQISDDEAAGSLLAALAAEHPGNEILADPRFLRFTTGRRTRSRHKNCVSLGLASGFLEPLESTSIHLVQFGLMKLAASFPRAKDDPVATDFYNRIMADEMEQIRDFLIYHYHANRRVGEPLWDRMRALAIPESLREKIDLYRTRGQVIFPHQSIFVEPNWLAVMMGQHGEPEGYDPLADRMDDRQLAEYLQHMRIACRQAADRMPSHASVLERLAAAAQQKAGSA